MMEGLIRVNCSVPLSDLVTDVYHTLLFLGFSAFLSCVIFMEAYSASQNNKTESVTLGVG